MLQRIHRPAGSRRDLSHLRLGPRRISGHVVLLRPPRFDDFAGWRRIRLRDRALIEPFWVSSELDWNARHTEKLWIRECLAQRRSERDGRNLSLVIEVDGQFSGQCSIGAIDAAAATGELGIWVDAKVARRGVGGLAIAMVLDFGFAELGLERITAPICVDNEPTARGAVKMGLAQEAVMTEYFDAGGRRKDHGLWVALRESSPPEGFVQRWIQLADPAIGPGGTRTEDALTPTHTPGTRPQARTALAAVGRFYLGELRAVGQVRSACEPRRLGPAGRPAVLLRRPRMSDYRAKSTPRLADRTVFDQPESAESRRHSRLGWLRECVDGRRALRAHWELPFVAEIAGRLVGECGLRQVAMFNRSAELYLWVTADRRDPDAAECTIQLLLEHSFGTIGLHRVAAVCDTGDELAAAVFANAGLICEGTMHSHVDTHGRRGDHDLWAITATRYQRRVSL